MVGAIHLDTSSLQLFLVLLGSAVGSALIATLGGFGVSMIALPLFLFFLPAPIALWASAIAQFTTSVTKLAMSQEAPPFSLLVRAGVPLAITSFVGSVLWQWLHPSAFVMLWVLGGATAISLLGGRMAAHIPHQLLPLLSMVGGALNGLIGAGSFILSPLLVRLAPRARDFLSITAALGIMASLPRFVGYVMVGIPLPSPALAGVVAGGAVLGVWAGYLVVQWAARRQMLSTCALFITVMLTTEVVVTTWLQ